mgnify:CR=1 FL=1
MIMFAGVGATLAISPWSNLDPISLPKLLVLSSFGFAIFGLLLSVGIRNRLDSATKVFFIASALFLFWICLVVFVSGAPISQQIWGMFGRNTGMLAYVSLCSLAMGSALLGSARRNRVLIALLLTTIPINLYCFVQLSGKDPVQWSEFQTFATLGNVNFLSAFLGITSIALLAISWDEKRDIKSRFALILWIIVSLGVVWSTGSIQGIMAFLAGFVALTLLWISKSKKKLVLFSLLIPVYVFFLVETILGLVNKGFLRDFIYQPSVVFRGDYMHAGWAMTLRKPFFGVGMDSYGDWYREVRGEVSTLRTGPDRIANTAHNVFLDISSNGGFPLLFIYLFMLGFAMWCAAKYWISVSKRDYIFMSILSAWVAFQVQAAVSINQLGVGVWGWVLTGLLVSYGRQTIDISNSQQNPAAFTRKKENRKFSDGFTKKNSQGYELLPASNLLYVLVFGVIGFIAAWIPLRADSHFRSASSERNLQKIEKAVSELGATAWHYNLAIDSAVTSNLADPAYKLSKELTSKFPRDYYGWRLLAILNNSTEQEKGIARDRMLALDPFNPENK